MDVYVIERWPAGGGPSQLPNQGSKHVVTHVSTRGRGSRQVCSKAPPLRCLSLLSPEARIDLRWRRGTREEGGER